MNSIDQLKELKKAAESKLGEMRKQLRLYSAGRLTVFIAIVLVLYFLWSERPLVWIISAFLAGVFLFLLRKYTDARAVYNHEKKYAFFLEQEISGNWKSFYTGKEFIDPAHSFTSDLGVFGRFSIFQYINRAESPLARKRMAQWLSEEILSAESIERESAIIEELSKHPEFLFRILAYGSVAGATEDGLKQVKEWSKKDDLKGSAIWWFGVRFALPALSIVALICSIYGVISINNLLLVLLIPFLVVGANLKKHQKIFSETSDILKRADAFRDILNKIRQERFATQEIEELISAYKLGTSDKGLHKLASLIGAIDSRNNVLVAVVLNLFLSWDFQCAYRLKKWKAEYAKSLSQWLELANIVETYASFGVYCFMHPDYTKAQLSKSASVKLKNASHILMDENAVPNGFELDDTQKIAILTGANMAGKSTYLRMVGTSMLLAMRGLPVRAAKFEFSPRRIFTSMLTVDSLGDSESYFFSELKRLRQLVDRLEAGTECFVILDEILKGTNSKDKAEGSKLFVKKLLSQPMKGIIATHDLSLCDLQSEYPEKITNLKFEIDFNGDDLVFNYQVEPGVCQNMNASFLLNKMGLSE